MFRLQKKYTENAFDFLLLHMFKITVLIGILLITINIDSSLNIKQITKIVGFILELRLLALWARHSTGPLPMRLFVFFLIKICSYLK